MDHIQSLIFLLYNVLWMGWNISLALVAVVLGYAVSRARSSFAGMLLAFLWLIFVPNTLYMVTDVIHTTSVKFTSMTLPFRILGVALYASVISLGVYTFYHATLPVVTRIRPWLDHLGPIRRFALFSVFSLLVGFAIAMGRYQRTNSWYFFTQPWRVIHDVRATVTSPSIVPFFVIFSACCFLLLMIVFRLSRLHSR